MDRKPVVLGDRQTGFAGLPKNPNLFTTVEIGVRVGRVESLQAFSLSCSWSILLFPPQEQIVNQSPLNGQERLGQGYKNIHILVFIFLFFFFFFVLYLFSRTLL